MGGGLCSRAGIARRARFYCGSGGWVAGGGRINGMTITGNNFSGNTSYAIRHAAFNWGFFTMPDASDKRPEAAGLGLGDGIPRVQLRAVSEEEHRVLREQEHDEADVGALLGEELPEFVAELEEEHLHGAPVAEPASCGFSAVRAGPEAGAP